MTSFPRKDGYRDSEGLCHFPGTDNPEVKTSFYIFESLFCRCCTCKDLSKILLGDGLRRWGVWGISWGRSLHKVSRKMRKYLHNYFRRLAKKVSKKRKALTIISGTSQRKIQKKKMLSQIFQEHCKEGVKKVGGTLWWKKASHNCVLYPQVKLASTICLDFFENRHSDL